MRRELPGAPLSDVWAMMLRTAVQFEDLESIVWVFREMQEQGVDPNSDKAAATPALQRALRWAWVKFPEVRKGQEVAIPEAGRPLPEAGQSLPEAGQTLPAGWSSHVDPSTRREY